MARRSVRLQSGAVTPSPRVGLFVTCVVDQVAPDVGIATVRLLEAAGALVEFPAAQTCCGQPAISAGEPEAAARLAQHFVDVFDECDAIVAPSGSCVAMVHHWFSRLLPHDDRVASLVHRTFELTTYLVDELGQTDFYAGGLGAPLDTTVTVHDACHGLRNLGIHDAPRALLEAAGATLIEMDEADTCCGLAEPSRPTMVRSPGHWLTTSWIVPPRPRLDGWSAATPRVCCISKVGGGG